MYTRTPIKHGSLGIFRSYSGIPVHIRITAGVKEARKIKPGMKPGKVIIQIICSADLFTAFPVSGNKSRTDAARHCRRL